MTIIERATTEMPATGRDELEQLLAAETGGMVPVSYGQRRLWVLEQVFPGTAVYTVNTVLRLAGEVDEAALQAAFDDLAARHEALRTTFPTVGGEPVQLIAGHPRLELAIADAVSVEQAEDLLHKAARQPFDLARGPLLRPLLVRIAGGDHRLLLNVHHIIVDGWSMGLIVRDLVGHYSARFAGTQMMVPAVTQYRDFAAWQDGRLDGAETHERRDYWRRRLAGPLGVIRLPSDRPRPANRGTGGDVLGFTFPAKTHSQMLEFCLSAQVTPYMVLLASYAVLLQRYSGVTDIAVASPVANRMRQDFEETVGYLGNTLPMRVDVGKDLTFAALLNQVRATALEALGHQDIPFDMIVEDVAPVREPDITPICQTMLAVQNDPVAVPSGVEVRSIHSGTAKYDLTLNVIEQDGVLHGHLEFSTDLFERETIQRLADNFVHLLSDALNRPETTVDRLELVSPAERELLASWNETTTESPVDIPVHVLFDRVAAERGDAVALVAADLTWTYSELAEASTGLAKVLRSHGVSRGHFVGLALERSFASVVWTLATLKAGAAYVPLDPAYPDERLRHIAGDTAMTVLVSDAETGGRIGLDPDRVLAPDMDWREAVTADPVEDNGGGDLASDPAYVIYTSGSTGTPKGVVVAHRGIVRLVRNAEFLRVTAEDTVTHLVPLTFDGSVMEMFGALLNGARLVLAPAVLGTMDDYCDLLESNEVTVSGLTSGLFPYLEERHRRRLGRLRCMLTGGDVLSTRAAREFLTDVPGCVLLNVYGPTENATATTTHAVSLAQDWSRSIPIGRPISSTTVHVLDELGQIVPIGVSGELYTGGLGVALGYLNLPEATAERFVPDPWFVDQRQTTMYRTGDRARWLADGTLEFLGRYDHQVQIRSFRVELGEIQACLAEHELVSQALVSTFDDPDGNRRLVAYVVTSPDSIDILRGYLEQRLPLYMVPACFVPMPGLPLNAHGKVDQTALPDPASFTADNGTEFTAPATPAERELSRIWAEHLHLDLVGIDDDFFSLGGDSIIGIQIVAKARRAGLVITPRMLLEGRTIRRIAESLTTGTAPVADDKDDDLDGRFPLTPIQQWFVEQPLAKCDHFNMSRLFDLAPGTRPEAIAAALDAILDHHDALRLRLDGDAQHYEQREAAPCLEVVPLASVPAGKQEDLWKHHAAEVQRELSLTRGPLVRALFADYGAERPPALFLVVHHFAMDGVSWRVLIEDLRTAYRQISAGQPVDLPPKTTSFKRWANALAETAGAEATVAKGRYWLDSVPAAVTSLPLDDAGGRNIREVTATLEASLGEEQTQALLRDVPRVYGTQIEDVMLTALAMTLQEWTGEDGVLIALEGHGREEIVSGLDLSRTVGWFTSAYPFMLSTGGTFDSDPGRVLRSVRDRLREVPDRGVPYGMLLRLTGDSEIARALRRRPQPQLSFNYMGQFSSAGPDASGISVSPATLAGDRAAEGARPVLVEVNAEVSGGRLRMFWSYSTECHVEKTIRGLADRHLAHLTEIIRHGTGHTAGLDRQRHWDLTAMQQGLLVHSRYEAQAGLYVVQWCGEFQYLDGDIFEQACQRIVDRHDALRVWFDWTDESHPVQVVPPSTQLPVERQDWTGGEESEQADRLAELLALDRARGFDVAVAPLMRLALLKLSDDRTQVVLTYHHAIADGWAIGIVMDDLMRIYRGLMKGRDPILPPSPSFGDYLTWLRDQDHGAAARFWREHLEGVSGPTLLGVERCGPCPSGERIGRQARALTAEHTSALIAAARGAEVTLNILCLGAWAVTASRYSGERNVVVGVTSAGRPADVAEVERMVGLFINTLPLRIEVDPGTPAGAWLRELQTRYWETHEYEYSALPDVQQWSGVDPRVGLFEHIFVFENYPDAPAGAHPWGDADLLGQHTVERIGYPLDVTVKPGPELVLELNYDRARYDDETVGALLNHFETALNNLSTSASRPLDEVSLVAAEERERIIERYIPAFALPAPDVTIHHLFEQRAAEQADAEAVAYDGKTINYDGLNQRANALAEHLRSLGVGRGSFVGIATTRCVEMLVGILAILKAGGAYVPISHKYPPARIAEMLQDVGIEILVTRRDLSDELPVWPGRLLYLEDWADEPASRLSNPDSGVKAADPCYVYFTSGSTGRPKAVVVTHGNLVITCEGYIEYYRLTEETRVHLQMANMSFDVFSADWTRALCTGKKLVLCPNEFLLDPGRLLDLINAQGVDFAEFVPVVLRLVADHLEQTGQRLDGLRVIVCGSDVWYGEEYDRFRRLCGAQTRLVNSYGVTEATVDNAMFEAESAQSAAGRPVPIGRPAPNEQLIILDAKDELCPLDVHGELCIGGAAVARYLNREDLNRERFAPNPFAPNGGVLYRTGDLARYSSRGYVELLGRVDYQIKIRGFRIEPGEIEAVLREHPDIEEALVTVVRAGAHDDAWLAAYTVMRSGAELNTSVLDAFLVTRLPWFMIPAGFVAVDSLPVSPNGKIDRRALPSPPATRPHLNTVFEVPADALEAGIAAIWQEVLMLDQVGVADNFREVGGTSLRAMKIAVLVRAKYDIDVSIRDVVIYPTIRGFAASLRRSGVALPGADRG